MCECSRLRAQWLGCFLSVFLVLYSSFNLYAQTHSIPGVIVDYSSATTQVYLGSPSIAILDDGTYVVSVDPFGPPIYTSDAPQTASIFASGDRGKTWHLISHVEHSFWSGLFTLKGALYYMGPTGLYGDLAIRKSTDGGHTWTQPSDPNTGLLRTDEQYHTAPVPVVIHDGRVWRALEDRNPPKEWGKNFRALVISAPVGSNLLKASNWKTSNRLRYNHDEWKGYAWLEGNIVVTPNGKLVDILRSNFRPGSTYGKAAVVEVSNGGEKVSFDPGKGFIDFPGGTKKFTIRFDKESGKYWSLTNYIPDEYADFDHYAPDMIRNTLALISSENLRDWEVNKIILQSNDIKHTGFQYADWLVEGPDIVAVIRTACRDENGVNAHSAHDSNYILFKRIENFRRYENTKIK